jgi:hypothetical protein
MNDGLLYDNLEEFDKLHEVEQPASLETLAKKAAGPALRFVCNAGCPCGNQAQCRGILRRAIEDAIRLANRAASRLEVRPRTAATIEMFRGIFGHPPNRPVPWGGGRDSGGIVARRYRLAVGALQTNNTQYECANIHAFARTLSPDRVLIGPRFWKQTDDPHGPQRFAQYRAGTILHEMMHQYFLSFILHDKRERRRNNAHCLTVFALRASRIPPRTHHIRQCGGRPA